MKIDLLLPFRDDSVPGALMTRLIMLVTLGPICIIGFFYWMSQLEV